MWNPGQGVPRLRAVLAVLLLATCAPVATAAAQAGQGARRNHWVDIWTAMPQLTEPDNLPPAPFNETGVVFRNATLRQTLKVSLGATTVRLRLSNAFGGADLPVTGAALALPAHGSAGAAAIVAPASAVPLTFSGAAGFTVPAGALVVSDPVELRPLGRGGGGGGDNGSWPGNSTAAGNDDYPLDAFQILTVDLYLASGQTTNSITSHPGSRTTSYFAPGNQLGVEDITSVDGVQSAEHWYFISAVEAWLPASSARACVVVGDSISDGRGSTTNANDRWPDVLGRRASAAGVAVVNQAAGGNRVLRDGLGPNALGRWDRDVLARSGAGYAVVLEGVNDIGTAADAAGAQRAVGDRLLAAFDQLVARAHARGLPVFAGTLTPFTGPGQAYGGAERERTRQRVNAWIRHGGRFDAVVDFDAVLRNASRPDVLQDRFDSGDHLHPNPAGYVAMAEAVPLELFERFRDGVWSML
ncbi:GDSL-like Lipase/Acylhydrolase [Xylariomycetidae sp. FL0641]|nr:GDSL-like Lipase/Acylhydrolase [Xylariomycetidae sp. FL0641]